MHEIREYDLISEQLAMVFSVPEKNRVAIYDRGYTRYARLFLALEKITMETPRVDAAPLRALLTQLQQNRELIDRQIASVQTALDLVANGVPAKANGKSASTDAAPSAETSPRKRGRALPMAQWLAESLKLAKSPPSAAELTTALAKKHAAARQLARSDLNARVFAGLRFLQLKKSVKQAGRKDGAVGWALTRK